MADKHKTDLTRRHFLMVSTAAALSGVPLRVNAAEVVPGKKSPNEKLNVGGIGVGGKGTGDILSFRRENIIAMADPDFERAREAFERAPKAKQYRDYREMLEKEKLDVVNVSTPDHTHAPAAFMAMNMGIHVYVQKPLTHTAAEARLLRETAKKMGVKTQMGNQGHCQDGVRGLCELMWSGVIGPVKEVHIWTNRPVWPQGIAEPLPEMPVPDTMSWDLWIGTAPTRPYNKEYAPFNWRGWWDFGCGALGDMACHIMDPANWALKLNEASVFTVERVQADGTNVQTFPNNSIIKYTFPARADMGPVDVYWYDGGLKPPRPSDIPADVELGDGNNGSLFIGEKGYLTCGEYGGTPRLLPGDRFADFKAPDPYIPRVRAENPYLNLIDAIRGDVDEAASNFEYAAPFTEMVVLGNACLKHDGKLEYSRETGKFLNNDAANSLLTKEYRKGWELPC